MCAGPAPPRGPAAGHRPVIDFKSLDDLPKRIEAFIAYFNDTLAKPYRWTYTGRVLKAG
jgi:hypothetical protein